MMGLHPCSVKENYLEELKIVEEYLSKRKFVAIGEIGLDFYWDTTFTKATVSTLSINKWNGHYSTNCPLLYIPEMQ